jgi:predicted RNA binding protein YcfA (HicA-like mRNA interferase family)
LALTSLHAAKSAWLATNKRYDAPVKYRQLLRMLQDDGWRHDRTTGSHMMYVHPTKPGPVVVPAGGKEGQDVPRGTLNSILKQAGLK